MARPRTHDKLQSGENQFKYLRVNNKTTDKLDFESTSNTLTILFHTDRTIVDKGWIADWVSRFYVLY